jgi:exonuclease SbcC
MRPLKLLVKGFTAFRDPVELDFTGLDVFAVSGPTGSGKSSLLDAITYALYGRVERVGDRVSQLISQGRPRMAVTLEFEVGNDRYRVARSTPSKGGTKILLERQGQDGEWRQAGEGADRVREAEPLIVRAIGLTYDGFTRSVLLPQGEFAEFLVGDPRKRREILTELLGLELFKRMAERAGAIAKEAAIGSQSKQELLEREYADATPDALKRARAEARAARSREEAVAEAARIITEIQDRWDEARRSVEQLRACTEEVTVAARNAEAAAEGLNGLAARSEEARQEVERCEAAQAAADEALEQARADLKEAEASLGSVDELAGARALALTRAKSFQARWAKSQERDGAVLASHDLQKAFEACQQQMGELTRGLSARQRGLGQAEATLEKARHADLVATVSAGLHPGDPCPVCGAALEKAPLRAKTGVLKRAGRDVEVAREALEAARSEAAAAERALDRARGDLATNAKEQDRLAAELQELEARIAADEEPLRAVLGDPLPEDPEAEIESRRAELRRLDRTERECSERTLEAGRALVRAERASDGLKTEVERLRHRLLIDYGPLLDRAARARREKASAVKLPVAPSATDLVALGHFAELLAEALGKLAESLAREVEERSSLEATLLDEANVGVAGLVEPALTLEALARAVEAASRKATAGVATMAQRASDIAERVKHRRALLEDVKQLDDRSRVFKALAQELRADHLIAFLQAEALQLLAAAGSDRLSGLSEGRYRMTCRSDEFFVIDTWNGDEERSVRTLSGGETFLASLALALALSDQVRSLSVTDRARLDSLFLDEGFGTLDAETLRVVVDAIEQLGGNGRLVGVITHVTELAEQFPRAQIEKSPRGSHLKLVPT